MTYRGGVLGGLVAVALAGQATAQDARFSVRTQVVNPDLSAFTTTVGGLGNGAELMRGGGGFEPQVFRNRITAVQDAPDTIFASQVDLTNWDSWPEGMLNGADVEVLRIVDGEMKTVRRDQVAPDGFHASGWLPILPQGQVLPPEVTRWNLSWDYYNRTGVPWYYTVRAIDAAGNMSLPTVAVAITPPDKPGKVNETQPLQKMKLSGKQVDTMPGPSNLSARLTVSRTAMLSWDPVPGAAGYMIFRSDLPPERQRGYSISLAGKGESIRKGDMVLLRKKFYAPTRAEVATNRVWNSSAPGAGFGVPFLQGGFPGDPGMPPVRLVAHEPDTPVQDPGETYLQADVSDGRPLMLGKYNFSGPAETYYPTLDPDKTYRFEIWLRARGAVSARFNLGGVYKTVSGLPAEFQVGPEWRRYVVDFRVPPVAPDNKGVGTMAIRLSGAGQVSVDNLRIYQLGTDFMGLRSEDRDVLAQSGMSALRMHMFIKTGSSSYDLAQLLEPAGVPPQAGGHSLPQMLEITKSVGMEPWIQVEPHFSAEEWLGLVEYLAAPFDPAKDDPKALPWAARRVAQGHPAPWTDDFQKIWFEIGNETWNGLFKPWVFPGMADQGRFNWTKYSAGDVYGLYQEHVLSIMKQSPWWSRLAPELEPVIGGWSINDYGLDALSRSPSTRVLTNAAYIGGWDSGETAVRQTPDSYASIMAFAPQMMDGVARRFQTGAKKIARGRDLILGTYESGPGYELNGLNGAKVSPDRALEQELVMKSAAVGAATLDSFLTRAVAGDRTQNFFTFGRGNLWRSHARLEDGGLAYPSWDWLALFNRLAAGGDLLTVDTLAAPTRDVPEMGRRKAMQDVPMAAAYAVRKEDSLVVVVVSRNVPGVPDKQGTMDGRMSVQFELPIRGAARLTRYRESGDYRAQNYTRPETRITPEEIAVPADPARLEIADLAPASAEIYVFEGAEFTD